MGGMRSAALLLLLVATAALAFPAAAKPKGKITGGPNAPARTSDIPYIKCQVCELLAKNAWKQVVAMKKTATAANKVDEMKIIEAMERITVAWKPEGEWIAKIDLVEDGDKLQVKEMDRVGNCGVECKTVQLAAERIVGEHDTDMAEVLFTGKKNRAQFTNWLCYELSEACRRKPPPLPKDRTPGSEFDPRQEGDQNLDAMLGGLAEVPGLGNNFKLREELMEKLGVRGPSEDDPQSAVDTALREAMAKAEAGGAGQPAENDPEWKEL